MHRLIGLSKTELIARLVAAHRLKSRLQTRVARQRLAANLYKALHETGRARATRRRLLDRIQVVARCNRSPEIRLSKIETADHQNGLTEAATQTDERPPPAADATTSGHVAARLVCQWPECGRAFLNRTLFMRHVSSAHNQSGRMCAARPPLPAPSAVEPAGHVAEHVAAEKRLFWCLNSKCDYKTSNQSHLRAHQRRAHERVHCLL